MIGLGRHQRFNFNKTTAMVAVLSLVLVIGGLLYSYNSQNSVNLNNVKDVERLVGKHYLLPTNEVPALATVTDSSKITTKFLQKAKNGDKILIYQKNGRVIIYRPSIDRIIDVGPVEIGQLKK